MFFHSSGVMRDAEQALFAQGSVSSLALMDKAITRLARLWRAQPRSSFFSHCVVFAGHGNNAGDAIGLAHALGLPCSLRLASRLSEDAQVQLSRLQRAGLLVDDVPDDARLLIIDGLLGTGARGALREPIAGLIAELNTLRLAHYGSFCLAIDVPSGLESGGICVVADATASIGCVKLPLVDDAATPFVGEILPIPLPEVSLPPPTSNSPQLTTGLFVQKALPRRDYECYKNKAGHVHIIAGSKGYVGAAQLAAEAALSCGAGLVTLYALPDIYDILAARLAPELILRPIDDYSQVDCSKSQALLIGPGLGQANAKNAAALCRLIQDAPCPLVLDADGIKFLAQEQLSPPPDAILTPHEGEMRYLAGCKIGSRLDWALDFIQKHPCTLLLKGARSIIASPNHLNYNSTGGPHMANAGQGDCLAGCIAALRAQGLTSHEAASAGAWLCGQTAQYAQAHQGMSPHIKASQMINMFPRVLGAGSIQNDSMARCALDASPALMRESPPSC